MSTQTSATLNTVAIIGAGLSGCLCARLLTDRGLQVTLFDKARHVGGRTSTRQSRQDDTWVMDHGLPAFHAESIPAQQWLAALEQQGVIQRWTPRMRGTSPHLDRFVGVPFNHTVTEHLAKGLTLHTQTRITSARRHSSHWMLMTDDTAFGPFDALILTAPPVQTRAILPQEFHDPILMTPFAPSHAMMMRFDAPLDVDWDAAKLDHAVLSWVSRESSKPGRESGERWLVQTTSAWSSAHLETEPRALSAPLLAAFHDLTGTDKTPAKHQVHRWRYARPDAPLERGSWWDPSVQLGLCGDWLNGGQLEGAFHSGHHLAAALLNAVKSHA